MQTIVCSDWICPDLTAHWQLGQISTSDHVLLQAQSGDRQLHFPAMEGFALRYFTGRFSVAQVQAACRQQFGDTLPPNLVV